MSEKSAHWETVYNAKADDTVSWFEETPRLSKALIEAATPLRDAAIDIGSGASRLPEALLELGFADIACLDLSATALQIARDRLGAQSSKVRWIVADVTDWTPDRHYDVWHDCAVFHFLTDPIDQRRYRDVLDRALGPTGVAVIGTFAPDGPERCSGLPVVRHDAASLAAILGDCFSLVSEVRHDHRTPGGSIQKLACCRFGGHRDRLSQAIPASRSKPMGLR